MLLAAIVKEHTLYTYHEMLYMYKDEICDLFCGSQLLLQYMQIENKRLVVLLSRVL